VAIAVTFASIASSLTVDRNLWLAIAFSVLDVGEVLLPAWLIERWFGAVFKLEEVRQVLGFVVASAIGAAVAAAAAAIAISFVEPAAIPFNVWRLWFASCSLGLITVAPLLIGLVDASRERPPRRELIEGAIALVTLAALSAFLISLPQGPWATALPVAIAFPVLLWVAVRCRPVFAAGAACIVALAIAVEHGPGRPVPLGQHQLCRVDSRTCGSRGSVSAGAGPPVVSDSAITILRFAGDHLTSCQHDPHVTPDCLSARPRRQATVPSAEALP
jgi:integral membrane sensor domain MASE1